MDNIRYLVILDLEATCGNVITQEIIEFSTVLVDIGYKKKIAEFQQYVKPVNEPILTTFCKDLTGITQHNIDNGIHIIDTFRLFEKWLDNYNLKDNYIIMTCGDWDIGEMIITQCEKYDIDLPTFCYKWMNIQVEFEKTYMMKKHGMMKMLKYLNIKHTGKHHSGLDDCRNIANILIRMLDDGYKFDDTDIRYLS